MLQTPSKLQLIKAMQGSSSFAAVQITSGQQPTAPTLRRGKELIMNYGKIAVPCK
jgi:hypothetical protein